MKIPKKIGKREFIQHTSKYIKCVEEHGIQLLITHHNQPGLILLKIKRKTLKDLQGSIVVKINGDINEPVLPGYEEW